MNLYESFDFSEGGVAKIAFSLERLNYERIFLTEFGETFFAGFLVVSFFLSDVFCSPEKNSQKLINENLSKVR